MYRIVYHIVNLVFQYVSYPGLACHPAPTDHTAFRLEVVSFFFQNVLIYIGTKLVNGIFCENAISYLDFNAPPLQKLFYLLDQKKYRTNLHACITYYKCLNCINVSPGIVCAKQNACTIVIKNYECLDTMWGQCKHESAVRYWLGNWWLFDGVWWHFSSVIMLMFRYIYKQVGSFNVCSEANGVARVHQRIYS